MPNTLVFSCHADTGFRNHRLRIDRDGDYYGYLDNFVGVHAVMNAYFSGWFDYPCVRIELTYGEETDMEGAYEVMKSLAPGDTVIVVDVTAAETTADITIEKCVDPELRAFVTRALDGVSFDLYEDCPDPLIDEDECDVYVEKVKKVCFLGIPCTGGDYNLDMVKARRKSVAAATQAILQLAGAFADTNGA